MQYLFIFPGQRPRVSEQRRPGTLPKSSVTSCRRLSANPSIVTVEVDQRIGSRHPPEPSSPPSRLPRLKIDSESLIAHPEKGKVL